MPVWCNVGDTERRLAASDPDLHALYFEGVGMEPALRPLDLRSAGRARGAAAPPAYDAEPCSDVLAACFHSELTT